MNDEPGPDDVILVGHLPLRLLPPVVRSRRDDPVAVTPVVPIQHGCGGTVRQIAAESRLHRCDVCEQGFRKIEVTL